MNLPWVVDIASLGSGSIQSLGIISTLVAQVSKSQIALLTVALDDPAGYGRIVRGQDGHVVSIVEENDANDTERALKEVNTGILAAPAARLRTWLDRIDCDNSQGEYYLTDAPALIRSAGDPVATVSVDDVEEAMGINDVAAVARVEAILRERG